MNCRWTARIVSIGLLGIGIALLLKRQAPGGPLVAVIQPSGRLGNRASSTAGVRASTAADSSRKLAGMAHHIPARDTCDSRGISGQSFPLTRCACPRDR